MRMTKPLLIDSPSLAKKKSKELGINLSHVEIIDPATSGLVDRYTHLLLTDWRPRGITEVEAKARLENPMYFAAAMVHASDAKGSVGNAATTTAETVRAAIHCIGLNAGSKIVSSFFLMLLPNTNLIFADCAVVPTPTVPQL